MILQINKIVLLLCLFCLTGQAVFSQPYTSKNNYTGTWETPSSWDPVWPAPQTSISGYSITINGYITANSSLSFSGTASNLIIEDTLVVKGNLTLDNNNDLTINNNGILIVRGNLTINNQTLIVANGYFIITGDIIKASSIYQGSFTGNDNPFKVYIGGVITSAGLSNNNPDYPVLNCTAPTTTPYPNSTCSYGNMTDIMNDPIYSFFQSTCAITTVSSNSPVCNGSSIYLTAAGGASYNWSGPDGFTSNTQNPSIPDASSGMAGVYTVTVTAANGCTVKDTTRVKVDASPEVIAGSNSPVCEGNTIDLASSGGADYRWTGPGGFISTSQNQSINDAVVSMSGPYTVTVTALNGCADSAIVQVMVNPLPLVAITSSNSAMCINDQRTLTGDPSGGTFTITEGPGSIAGNILSANGTGNIGLEYNYSGTCINKATQSILVMERPVAVAGPDQELSFVFETLMNAELSGSETGEWSLVSGSGRILDVHSPTTALTDLSVGENVFAWTVGNGSCASVAEVKITVYDLFVPSVITPNGDGKNDCFKIGESLGPVEIIIFNRWGNEEFANSNYLNDWGGRNNHGRELPNDTYYYVLKFENGAVKKGSVLILR